jgi:hypothetical protein
MVNISSQDRFWKTPMRTMMPMIPKEMNESFCASSSIETWRGVRFSSTWRESESRREKELAEDRKENRGERRGKQTHVLHHGEDDSELGLFSRSDDDTRAVTYERTNEKTDIS